MAARQIPQYTDAQLARELSRTQAVPDHELDALDADDFVTFVNYRSDLCLESNRRARIRLGQVAA